VAIPAGSIDTQIEMYLRPVSTGVADWTTIPAPLRDSDVVVTDGNRDQNADPGVPNWCTFTLKNSSGDFTRKNPMGAYYGSIGKGVQTRISVLSVDDTFTRTVANTNWGAVGNTAGDTWTAGTSSGGSVLAGDWSVGSGVAKHSLPVAGAYRLSELAKTTRKHNVVEVTQIGFRVPTTNVTGTGALATEIWMRALDINNNVAASVAFQIDETLQIALFERIAGTARYFLNYATLPGLNLGTTGTDYNIKAQCEGSTVRAKVWQTGTPEPVGWSVTGYGATVREGYSGVADFAFAGNTNAYPLVFQRDRVVVRVPMIAGEITDLNPSGDGKSTQKIAEVRVSGLMDRLQSSSAPAESVMKRGRSRERRWLRIGLFDAVSGDQRTFTVTTATLGNIQIGDYFFLTAPTTGLRKEDTKFTIVGTSVAGANTSLLFTPDAREAVAATDIAEVFRGTTSAQRPIAYWPCEDGDNASQVSSGLPSGEPLSITGSLDFGAESGFTMFGSSNILKIKDAELRAFIPDYVDPGYFTINFLLSMPATDEAATGSDLVQFYATGTGYSYDLQYLANGGGSFQLQVYNSALTLLYSTGPIDFSLRGNKQMVTLVLQQVGGNVTYSLYTVRVPGVISGGVGPTNITGATTLGKITEMRVNPAGGYSDVGYGHMTIIPANNWGPNELYLEISAWANRNSLLRLGKIAFEDNIDITFRDDWDVVTTNIGPQKTNKLVELIKEPAESDMGLLHGCRGAVALEYITRGALTNQTAKATFRAVDTTVLDPKDDFTNVQNRVTVTRVDGTSFTAEQTTGAMSTQDAPNGIGLRDKAFTISLGSDTQVTDQAYARLGLGVFDQYRVPQVVVSSAGASQLTIEQMLSLSVGDRVDLTALTSLFIYDTLPQLVIGISFSLGDRFYPKVTLNCVPYEPYSCLALTGDRYSRIDAVDTATAGTLTTTATGALSISSTAVYAPSTDTADYPVDVMISGERITLSAMVDTATPGVSTATISARSVNGVVKTHAVGEPITLAEPNYWQTRR
jgi:hypothetical protein